MKGANVPQVTTRLNFVHADTRTLFPAWGTARRRSPSGFSKVFAVRFVSPRGDPAPRVALFTSAQNRLPSPRPGKSGRREGSAEPACAKTQSCCRALGYWAPRCTPAGKWESQGGAADGMPESAFDIPFWQPKRCRLNARDVDGQTCPDTRGMIAGLSLLQQVDA